MVLAGDEVLNFHVLVSLIGRRCYREQIMFEGMRAMRNCSS
jgi:hypothetical protein